MGTSTDYTGGTGGKWTPYKRATSYFTRLGGEDRADRVLARYVKAAGGAAGIAGGGTTAAVRSTQGLAGFGVGIAEGGLSGALREMGLERLIGCDRFEVIDGLLEALGGEGATLEDQAVLAALCEAFEELWPEDADTYEDLEEVSLDAEDVARLIERFVARWVYDRMLPTLAEKFTHIEDPEVVRSRDQLLRDRLNLLVSLELQDSNPLGIDWRGDEGETILTTLVNQVYEDMEDLE